MYEDRNRWDMDFAGVLAMDGEISTGKNSVIINKNNNLQYYIRIISNPLENFPNQIKHISGFAEELDDWGFYDDITLPNPARKQALRDFLKRYILFFQIELRRPNATEEFHVAKNIHIVKKSNSLRSDATLYPIPIFSEETTDRNQDLFEKQLCNRKLVGDNKNISKDDDDTPSMILWKHTQDEYTLYGQFKKHDYVMGGFRFYPTSSHVRKINLQLEYIMESYRHEQVLFMDSKYYEELKSMLDEHGDAIENVEGVEQVIKQTVDSVAATIDIDANSAKNSEEHSNRDKEVEFMELFENECKKMGLYYDEKDLYNFHTAMKAGGLVILAGMSGTGKSKLVQCYARALRLGNAQLLFIPVRPSWQDDADVIGYLDTLHNVYRPGDSGLMNVLTRAAKDYPDDLHIVCFDEMNLARVEHYFSQFLSVLELEENRRFLKLYNDEYSSRIYNQNSFPSTVRIGSNVIFVGTVNLDESTYHFSDKVLDRANVITLNIKPYDDVLKMEEQRIQELPTPHSNTRENPFPYEVYSSFRKIEREISLKSVESKFLWRLHEEFQKCSRSLGIGWRIIRQISHFLNNLPVNAPLTREEAFDLQVVQRVLTKVRGSEEQFTELLGRYNTDTKQVEQSKFFNLLSTMPDSYKFERTRKLITEKSKELRLYGHTI